MKTLGSEPLRYNGYIGAHDIQEEHTIRADIRSKLNLIEPDLYLSASVEWVGLTHIVRKRTNAIVTCEPSRVNVKAAAALYHKW